MKNIKIYVKKTLASEWQYIGTVYTAEHANRVYANCARKGYHCKAVEE